MFRLSHILRQLERPTPPSDRGPIQPVVVWNLLRRCNLDCIHCYAAASDREFQGELTTAEILRVLADLVSYGIKALILSGGEPLLHPDWPRIAGRAKELGCYVGLSSNGTLLGPAEARIIADLGLDYVGISLDGLPATHDRIRRREGGFQQAMNGLRHCRDLGIKVGARMTLTRENAAELPDLLELLQTEAIPRFYLSHWNHAGRGKVNRVEDATQQATRQAMRFLFELAREDLRLGRQREIVTGNNDADGPALYLWSEGILPEHNRSQLRQQLERWGGNASGVGVANIDNRGNVHPDIFWWHETLGNLREQSFAAIWDNPENPLLAGLRQRPRPVEGRCARCGYLAMCGGNTRVRAHQTTGNPWAEDPGCYLTDGEINKGSGGVTPPAG